MKQTTEFLIVGGGIVALTLARELIANGVDRIIILEKEPALGLHASGRNSGVLHAGIYYPPETLKAQLCLKGNLMMQEYCETHKLPLIHAGKVIVAKNADELSSLITLYERAKQNGAKVELIDDVSLSKLEPLALTYEKALFSHYTAIIDNKAVLTTLHQELTRTGKVEIQFDTAFMHTISDHVAQTTKGTIHYQQLINSAGAYADKIAHAFGIAREYYFLPFKGIYKKLIPEKAHLVNGNIYPVPNLHNPFLGVHFTKNIQGDVYVGPTAIPAFGRENYGLLQGIDSEAWHILKTQLQLFLSNPQFRHVALEEPKKYVSSCFFNDAKKLVKTLEKGWLTSTNKVGIRPQLIDMNKKELMMDFFAIKEDHTLHILNAISPAFTSSMAFAKYIMNQYYVN